MAQGFDKLPSWTATVFLFAILTIAPGAAAQFHTAPWTLIGKWGTVARIDAKGTITTVIPASAMPSNMWFQCGTVDIDDQSMVIAFGQSNGPWNNPSGGLLFFDRWGMILKTVYSNVIGDVIVDDDGSYLATECWSGHMFSAGLLYRVSRAGSIRTIHFGVGRWFQSVQVDIDTGDYRVLDTTQNAVLGIARNGNAITTLATLPSNMWFPVMRQHVGDGSLYLCNGWHPPQSSVLRVSRSGAVTTFVRTNFKEVSTLRWDRVSAPHRRLVVCAYTPTGPSLFFVDEQTRVVIPRAVPKSIYPRALVPPREVASRRIAPGQWEFGLHFAGHTGKAYAMGFSLSGVRPPVVLGDGRRIHLAVDALTALSLSGQVAPILTHNVGILGATDRAVVHLDLRALPENVAGINLYGLAVVLDPAAPLGVAIIADPIRVRL
jgi:hypothetical protein